MLNAVGHRETASLSIQDVVNLRTLVALCWCAALAEALLYLARAMSRSLWINCAHMCLIGCNTTFQGFNVLIITINAQLPYNCISL